MLCIISSPSKRTEQTVQWVEFHTEAGSITILPDHAPYQALITPQSIVTMGLDTDRTESITLANGYVRVDRSKVLIITS